MRGPRFAGLLRLLEALREVRIVVQVVEVILGSHVVHVLRAAVPEEEVVVHDDVHAVQVTEVALRDFDLCDLADFFRVSLLLLEYFLDPILNDLGIFHIPALHEILLVVFVLLGFRELLCVRYADQISMRVVFGFAFLNQRRYLLQLFRLRDVVAKFVDECQLILPINSLAIQHNFLLAGLQLVHVVHDFV